jgi:hypothetical protein
MHPAYPIICAGFLTFAIVRILPKPEPPCPRITWKHILAFIFAIIGAVIYVWVIGFKTPIDVGHFLSSQISGFALGATIYGILCPLE